MSPNFKICVYCKLLNILVSAAQSWWVAVPEGYSTRVESPAALAGHESVVASRIARPSCPTPALAMPCHHLHRCSLRLPPATDALLLNWYCFQSMLVNYLLRRDFISLKYVSKYKIVTVKNLSLINTKLCICFIYTWLSYFKLNICLVRQLTFYRFRVFEACIELICEEQWLTTSYTKQTIRKYSMSC